MAVTEAADADTVVLEISDDGRGIEWARLREKAMLAGLPCSTEADLIQALFADGMTTKDVVNEYSGRGVGMGAVRAACEALAGRIEIESSVAIGTKLRFVFPRPGAAEGVAKLQAMISIPPRVGVSLGPVRVAPAPRPSSESLA